MALSKRQEQKLKKLSKLVRYYILTSTTSAGSGHPTSSLSAADLMTTLVFGGIFRYSLAKPQSPNNDRLIFSKGHAAPLLYSLSAVAGKISEKEINKLRKFSSNLEGHPTMRFPYTECASGSLGQGLSVGVGMALNAKYIDKLPYTTYVLLGDSEMSEGSIWEAIQLASYYKLNNLVGIIDVNRLGQRGQTMLGHNLNAYNRRVSSFGWKTFIIDGHSQQAIHSALLKAQQASSPTMIIAKTLKGKGVSFLENKNGWHGKTLTQKQLSKALITLGSIDHTTIGSIKKPLQKKPKTSRTKKTSKRSYKKDELVATRKAYGEALTRLAGKHADVVVLDAEVSNSTYSEQVKKSSPAKFFEMFIAEQNMVGVGLGLARRGKTPFISSFAAFLTRAFDQIRMSQYSDAHMVFCGSHAGVSIGEDGASQMGLEDIAMFRTIQNSVVLYPSDAVATYALTHEAWKARAIVYIRTTRMKTPILYTNSESFPIGGSKTLRSSKKDSITILASGITVHEALRAYDLLKDQKVHARVIDLYSIKPIDKKIITKVAKETKTLFVVEDHVPEGGIIDAVRAALPQSAKPIISLAVTKRPRSGKPHELLRYEGIAAQKISSTILSFI